MKYVLIYLATISLIAIILTLHDKNAAAKGKRRVKERTLLLVAAIGGSITMLATIIAIRHKTRRKKLIVVLIVYIFNAALSVGAAPASVTVIEPRIMPIQQLY